MHRSGYNAYGILRTSAILVANTHDTLQTVSLKHDGTDGPGF